MLVGLSGWGALRDGPQLTFPRIDGGEPIISALVPQLTALRFGGLIARGTIGAMVGFSLLLPFALLLGRWPGRTAVAGAALLRRMVRALAIGLILTATLVGLQLLAVQLAVTPVGLPLAALLVALAHVHQKIGLVTLVRALGARLEGKRSPGAELEWPTAAVAATLALGLAITAAFASNWTLALFALLAAPGLGAVVISRVGTLFPEPIHSNSHKG
jgi:hypothetical protein